MNGKACYLITDNYIIIIENDDCQYLSIGHPTNYLMTLISYEIFQVEIVVYC